MYFLILSVGMGPVSYTHLDVYKRQVLLIGATCVIMNLLLCSSGVYYMDTIADSLQGLSLIHI